MLMSGSNENRTNEAPKNSEPFRTQLVQVLAAPWGCRACNAKGLIFEPYKLKILQDKYEFNMECPNCKAVVHLTISKILVPQSNAQSLKPLIQGA